jgi:hypothetical protein
MSEAPIKRRNYIGRQEGWIDVGYEIWDEECRKCDLHRTSHIYEALQLRATEPSQKGEMARSSSIIGGITFRIKSISSSVL